MFSETSLQLRYYLSLKFRIFCRYTLEAGYVIIIFYPLTLSLIFGAIYLLSTQPNGYLYSPFIIAFLIQTQHNNRKDLLFLKNQIQNWRLLVFVEYLFWLSPIFIFLILIGSYLSLPILVLLVYLSIFIPRYKFLKKAPRKLKISKLVFIEESFEWLSGMRKSLYLVLLFLLLIISTLYDNKIGMILGSTLFLIFLTTFYSRCENRLWVWIYPLSPKTFLLRKLNHFFQLLSPYLLILAVCFLLSKQSNWLYLSFPIFSLIMLNLILLKYVYIEGFPIGHKLLQDIILLCGLFIYLNPAMLVFQIFFFFYLFVKAQRSLKSIL